MTRKHQPPNVSEAEVLPSDNDVDSKQFDRQQLIDEIKETADKLNADQATLGDLKILARTLRELRYAFKVFKPYRKQRKVTVFGSARMSSEAPAYRLAVDFGKRMADEGWYVVTGAGGGVMQAAHEGAGREMSMGLNIMLPFEQSANPIIDGDEKLVHLKYFFTRKLLFVKEVHAIVLSAGGFGTLDEALETLTLVQTGKRDLMPIVMMEHPSECYWSQFDEFIKRQLLRRGLISPEDLSLYRIVDNVDDAVEEVMQFYSVYNSMRYVGGKLVLRLHKEPSDEFVHRLNDEFGSIVESGRIEKTTAHPHEADDEHLKDLSRLQFVFNRRDQGRLRQMVDLINDELGDE